MPIITGRGGPISSAGAWSNAIQQGLQMFMLLKSEEKEEAKWAARDARDEQLFQLESKRIQHQLDKFERENARFQTAQQDQQLQAASLRNQILRGGGDGMALPGGMVEPAPTTPFGGGAAPLARAPGGPASSGLAPPPGGELTPVQALAGSDMSTRPSIMGGVVGEDIQSVWTDRELYVLERLSPAAVPGFVKEMGGLQDQRVHQYDIAALGGKLDGAKRLVAGSLDAEGMVEILEGLRQEAAGASPDELGEIATRVAQTIGGYKETVQNEALYGAWTSHYDRTQKDLYANIDMDPKRRDRLLERLDEQNDLVLGLAPGQKEVVDPRKFIRNMSDQVAEMLSTGLQESEARFADLEGRVAATVEASRPPVPVSEYVQSLSEEERVAVADQFAQVYLAQGEEGVAAAVMERGLVFDSEEQASSILESIRSRAQELEQAAATEAEGRRARTSAELQEVSRSREVEQIKRELGLPSSLDEGIEKQLEEEVAKRAAEEERIRKARERRNAKVFGQLREQSARGSAGGIAAEPVEEEPARVQPRGTEDLPPAEEADYDYESARAAGLEPDDTGHWPSRVPSGENEGLILKDVSHPTFKKTVEEDLKRGYRFYGKDGRIYSFRKKPGDEFQLLHDLRDIAEFVGE